MQTRIEEESGQTITNPSARSMATERFDSLISVVDDEFSTDEATVEAAYTILEFHNSVPNSENNVSDMETSHFDTQHSQSDFSETEAEPQISAAMEIEENSPADPKTPIEDQLPERNNDDSMEIEKPLMISHPDRTSTIFERSFLTDIYYSEKNPYTFYTGQNHSNSNNRKENSEKSSSTLTRKNTNY